MIVPLFQPFVHPKLKLKNRIVMAPMTRAFAPGGVPTQEMAKYYQRRAEADVGLIVTEGTVVNRPSATLMPNISHFYGNEALKAWQQVAQAVHKESGKIAPQIWHQGIIASRGEWIPPAPAEGPSGLVNPQEKAGVAMDLAAIEATQKAFIEAAVAAKELGFDAVELHGAHGYLLDQFFWAAMNKREDRYGGATIAERSRFVSEIIRGIRERVGENFPIILRLSQWKQQDYKAKIANTPSELADCVLPLSEAGVDIFHCSQRRIADAEFAGSELNFAGWVKKLTGKATISVGSVGLNGDFLHAFRGEGAEVAGIDWVNDALDRGDFDLVAIGRALLADPEWAVKMRDGRYTELQGFNKDHLAKLY